MTNDLLSGIFVDIHFKLIYRINIFDEGKISRLPGDGGRELLKKEEL